MRIIYQLEFDLDTWINSGRRTSAALGAELEELVADRSVSAIVLLIDSPGGLASGLFDFTDRPRRIKVF